ncbi:NAD-dependent epimerase/dehydratase family protein [Azospirillum sp. TSA2s]|uniref:NAD-dependent epimerase/dehydratase family protein n=1 Tax=Azospirillum sp. TSA2s TaxID=709810 RepID=UPI0010AAFEB5|nr:NAD-dependent epimerase/dehydratase family protein [Azospirillum sp. TSA2s]QCG95390.1 NAD-dependent epimerase/dehydratase family protein [Azospirillum sp. TSA2s]
MEPSLVTGGSGFIGSHLVAALVDRGEHVRILDTAPPRTTRPNVTFLRGSVLDHEAVAEACDGVRQVFHLAAMAQLWHRDPSVFDAVNHGGTRIVLAAAMEAGVRRFIHCSTESVLNHGRPDNDGSHLGHEAMAGPYCRSKYLAEREALAAAERMPVVIVNPTAPIGPGDHTPTPPTAMLRLFLDGGPRLILNCNLNLVDVRDVADGMILAAERGVVGERYILGGQNLTLPDLADRIDRLAGRRCRRRWPIPGRLALAAAVLEEWMSDHITHRPPRAPATGVRLAITAEFVESTKAMRELGYKPRSLDNALADAVAWLMGTETMPASQPSS